MTSHAARDHAEHGSGALVLHHPDGKLDALILDARMDLQVQGLLATMNLVQTFRNTSDQWLAGSYLFPLPENAAVQGMRITIGERVIVSKIKPREQARVDYEQALQAGRIASLTEQQRPNLFTLQVANIAPGATIRVKLDVMLPVTMQDQRMHLNLPTTLTPRYLNTDSPNAQALQSDFVQSGQSLGPTLDATLTIEPLDASQSVTSNVPFTQASAQGFAIEDMPMNQDLTISWPAQSAAATHVQAFVTRHDGERYVQLLVTPPTQTDTVNQRARELIIVLDKSGSMAGVSMRAATEALDHAIDSLSGEDLLNIVAFDDQYFPLFEQSMAATDSVKHSARRFAARLQAEGGTEMSSALNFALQQEEAAVGADTEEPLMPLKQIVFITDGSVGNEEVLLREIRKNLGSSRLFTVGIGSAPNHWFLDKAAEAGRGTSVIVRHEDQVADAIGDLLNGLRYPVLTDIAIHYPRGQGEAYPDPVPDLYTGRPGMWVGKISEEVDEIVITALRQDSPFHESISLSEAKPVAQTDSAVNAPSVAMHWARQKIATLEEQQRYSAVPDLNKEAITRLAMQTGLISRYTSLIAVEETPSRPLSEALGATRVANHLPQGNQMAGITMPQGAAGVDTLLWISLLLGMSGCALLSVSRLRP